jgi:hypothetical protein
MIGSFTMHARSIISPSLIVGVIAACSTRGSFVRSLAHAAGSVLDHGSTGVLISEQAVWQTTGTVGLRFTSRSVPSRRGCWYRITVNIHDQKWKGTDKRSTRLNAVGRSVRPSVRPSVDATLSRNEHRPRPPPEFGRIRFCHPVGVFRCLDSSSAWC